MYFCILFCLREFIMTMVSNFHFMYSKTPHYEVISYNTAIWRKENRDQVSFPLKPIIPRPLLVNLLNVLATREGSAIVRHKAVKGTATTK